MIRRALFLASLILAATAPSADACNLKCLAATPAELDRLAAEPLKPLVRFDPEPLGRAIDPAITNLYRWFWRWHDASPRSGARVLDLEGSVAINGQPHDFALVVAQRGGVQLYQAGIVGYGSVIIAVHAPVAKQVELEYEFEPDGGGRPVAGSLRFDAP